MELLDVVMSALLFIAPAYVANAAPLAFSPLFKAKHPVDFGLTMPDGSRLLGEAKSWEGLAVGMALGSMTGAVLAAPLRGLVLSTGAMLGDLVGSFIKRRLKLAPGQPLPVLDQLDFLAGSLALAALFGYTVGLAELSALLLLTPPIHLATNTAAYALGLKDRPY
ncbi:MAG: CDP-2,3-bis-(O-geranylgeranyl)-sn-glycerol synthase [Thermoprotei archaeon]|nr:MAG: CDP-2,3-bis-(O-geranylgeranyl)-sn-glycerol synthase [Thermoprotei archaeon]